MCICVCVQAPVCECVHAHDPINTSCMTTSVYFSTCFMCVYRIEGSVVAAVIVIVFNHPHLGLRSE